MGARGGATPWPVIVYVATKNAGKLRELRDILGLGGFDARPYEAYADVVESADTYAGNAALKATALFDQLSAGGVRANVIGDDSGLEVAALGGRPGVRSARYGGVAATWPQRRALLLRELAGRHGAQRAARFVCALHFIDADGAHTSAAASYGGSIAKEERGEAGFSYDSIFVGQDGRTFAELSDREKNRISHRYLAATALFTSLSRPVAASHDR